MMLNEMFPPPRAPQYKVTSQTGPPNNPTFSMVCCIQDQTFPGEGNIILTINFHKNDFCPRNLALINVS